MLVKDIHRDQLAYYCAKAQGWNDEVNPEYWDKDNDSENGAWISKELYDPLTNGQQVYDLILKFDIELLTDRVAWWACAKDYISGAIKGADPAEAVMRAVITSHYGEEIREEE